MVFWLWFVLIGLLTYWVLRLRVARLTQTPLWLLWTAVMLPAFFLGSWFLVMGGSRQVPLEWFLGVVLLSMTAYLGLFHWGRRKRDSQGDRPSSENESPPSAETIPSSAEPTSTLRPIDQQEEVQLRNCFPWTVYYLQTIEYRPQAILCLGQLRGEPGSAYHTIRENVERLFGDRFLVLFQEGLQNKPFFVLVPNPRSKPALQQSSLQITRPGWAIALFVMTLFTTTLMGSILAGMTPESLVKDWSAHWPELVQGLPYALTLILILGIHELGHYLTARFYKIPATLPYFIPVPFFLGTLGAFIQIRAPIPNRKVLFDIGIAGPLAGFIVTVPLLMWGLTHSQVVPMGGSGSLLDFNALDPSASLLLALFSKLALGATWAPDTALNLHPVAVAGYLGLIVTAMNLMPVGQLDGGHIVHAMFGQRTGATIGYIARLLVFALALVRQELLLWAILLFVMPSADEPALNDVSQLDDGRDFWGLLALGILVLIVSPAPQILVRVLHHLT